MNRPARPGRFPLALDRLAGAGRPAATELLRPQRPLQHAAQHAAAQGQVRRKAWDWIPRR